MNMNNPTQPLTVLIAALGGQGGGVLTDWIAHAARAQDLTVQATSTPGVSQRTGATTYYLEIAATPAPGATPPVLGLTPMPGRVDILVCSEMLEAARMLERGLCTPSRTTLIASTHRVYTTREKITGGDGRFDSQRITEAAHALSRRAVLFDMEAVRMRHRAAISAVLFGALAGSGALGVSRDACEAAIRSAGIGVAESLAAFDAAWQIASAEYRSAAGAEPPSAAAATPIEAALPSQVATRIATLPATVAEIARIGAAQVFAYQNFAYATRYVDRVERIARAEAGHPHPTAPHAVAREAARHLALWMCYPDVIQVASRKARTERLARIRREVRASDTDVVRVYDLFKPSSEEIAAVLPRRIGLWLERRAAARSTRSDTGKGLTLQTSSVAGALALRLAAALRPLRPRSLRFAREQQAIEEWLAQLEHSLGETSHDAALALAQLPRLLEGYGETHRAGREKFERLVDAPLDRGGTAADNASPGPQPVAWLERG